MNRDLVKCKYCGKAVRQDRLEKHERKVHRRRVPVTKYRKKMLWCGSPMVYEDFGEIRQYIDACLEGDESFGEQQKSRRLTSDANLLIGLIDELQKAFPNIEPLPEFPKYRPVPMPTVSKEVEDGDREVAMQKLMKAWKKEESSRKEKYLVAKNLYEEFFKRDFEEIDRINFRKRVLDRLRMQIENNSIEGIIVRDVDWEILPSGTDFLKELIKRYMHIQAKKPERIIDFTRIKQMARLRPDFVYKGINEYDEYYVLCFSGSSVAVLDCPVVGNAIYVIRGDWKKLSRLSKGKLLDTHSSNVQKIVHRGDWFDEVKRTLGNMKIKRRRKDKNSVRRSGRTGKTGCTSEVND